MTTMEAQSMEALGYANRVRHARAAIKRKVAAGDYNPLEILQEPTELIKGMGIRELLLSVPHLGPKKVDKVLERCRISPNKGIGELTERQIWELDERFSTLNAWCVAIGPRRRRVSVR